MSHSLDRGVTLEKSSYAAFARGWSDGVSLSGQLRHRWAPDSDGNIRLAEATGRQVVVKRRPLATAELERRHASKANECLAGLKVDGIGTVDVVVPRFAALDDTFSLLITPFLGSPLSEDLLATKRLLSEKEIECLLRALLCRGVEASGCIPRNIFSTSTGLAIIDWEDARFGSPEIRPNTRAFAFSHSET